MNPLLYCWEADLMAKLISYQGRFTGVRRGDNFSDVQKAGSSESAFFLRFARERYTTNG